MNNPGKIDNYRFSGPVSNNNLPLALSNGVNIPINLEIGDYKVWDYVNEVGFIIMFQKIRDLK